MCHCFYYKYRKSQTTSQRLHTFSLLFLFSHVFFSIYFVKMKCFLFTFLITVVENSVSMRTAFFYRYFHPTAVNICNCACARFFNILIDAPAYCEHFSGGQKCTIDQTLAAWKYESIETYSIKVISCIMYAFQYSSIIMVMEYVYLCIQGMQM